MASKASGAMPAAPPVIRRGRGVSSTLGGGGSSSATGWPFAPPSPLSAIGGGAPSNASSAGGLPASSAVTLPASSAVRLPSMTTLGGGSLSSTTSGVGSPPSTMTLGGASASSGTKLPSSAAR